MRASIASILLVAGILWLARTTSIQDLMLNAVALNAILDVDELPVLGRGQDFGDLFLRARSTWGGG